MSNLLVLIFCFGLGQWLRKTRKLPASTPASLNGFIIYVSLPAVVLQSVHRIPLDSGVLLPASMAWIVFAASVAAFSVLARYFDWNRSTTGALVLTAGLCNTSFVGFPLIEALYGKQALDVAVMTDQPGSFLVLSTVGIAAAAAYSGTRRRGGALRRLLAFPPFPVLLAALVLRPFAFPAGLEEMLEKLGGTLAPIALFSVGFQVDLGLTAMRRYAGRLAAGLVFKLLLAPALMAVIALDLLGQRTEAAYVTVSQAAMAPMITGAIVAAEAGLEPELANLLIGVGIPLSLLTVPLWSRLLPHWP